MTGPTPPHPQLKAEAASALSGAFLVEAASAAHPAGSRGNRGVAGGWDSGLPVLGRGQEQAGKWTKAAGNPPSCVGLPEPLAWLSSPCMRC